MFKYKSPLSRLLEGAGKAKEDEAAEIEDTSVEQPEQAEKSEPIADFNALRQALAGGNMASESEEGTGDLVPEGQMRELAEAEEEAAPEPVAEHVAEVENAPAAADDQIVTLRMTEADAVTEEDTMLASVAEAATSEPEAEPEIQAEPEPVAEIIAEPTPVAEPAPEPVAVAEPVPAAEPVDIPAPAPAEDRRSRVKTTFLGFDRADTHVQDLIETAEPVAKTEAAQQTFPVGWLVVTSGPGRGASITVTEGLMQIGRNDDQAIQLDFGDTGISRSSHAVIAYDPEDRKCYLGHGGKANLVRLNGKPVLSTVPLSSGDMIRISETSIRFTAFCDDGFDWRDAD